MKEIHSQSFTGIGKLIDELKKAGVIGETDKQLNVLFDDWGESSVYKGNKYYFFISIKQCQTMNLKISQL